MSRTMYKRIGYTIGFLTIFYIFSSSLMTNDHSIFAKSKLHKKDLKILKNLIDKSKQDSNDKESKQDSIDNENLIHKDYNFADEGDKNVKTLILPR